MGCSGWLEWLSLALVAVSLEAKTPLVKWGQRPDRLYLTIPLPDVSEPEVTMEERRIYFKGISRGEEYEVTLKLLRGINVTESKHDINQWSISFDLKKLRKEPCWKRLLRSKSNFQWLKKDQDRWYFEDCQHAKEQWREAYFTMKLRGEEPGSKSEDEANSNPMENEKRTEKERWQKTLKEFRERAVPRASMTPKKKVKRPDQDEL
eukprot:CAMPEP_0179056494 /NCGR_PEP_ID=MMETSP0796-20121207/23840_1 /TAXON_ID=73915 /ORGANISM="Pyrodinium bahamense, Strain pbaha01" /LENGTH=205 /DNA_ID=CAMNT_0020753169 /DNA_START=36 /DNA_END=653 /DNA_ORIENTATION=+